MTSKRTQRASAVGRPWTHNCNRTYCWSVLRRASLMPGPKMGPRPADFDETVIRQSPTFQKWMQLMDGEKLRYACRDFQKGKGDDEERLMRRIMIARRNNIKDHENLKKARKQSAHMPSRSRVRRPVNTQPDHEVEKEMDVKAVERTRSYQNWLKLPDNTEFTYNQKYVKGKEGHDWLLRKNIWRRMRYRRENRRIVEALKEGHLPPAADLSDDDKRPVKRHRALKDPHGEEDTIDVAAMAAANSEHHNLDQAAVEAAVAAAENFGKAQMNMMVHNPLDSAQHHALDMAARLASAQGQHHHVDVDEDEHKQIAELLKDEICEETDV